jgi:cbb3-type cytochrome oxidase maturation protein
MKRHEGQRDEPAGGIRMTILYILIPIALALGLTGLAAFLWSLRSGQYDDMAGAAERILLDEDDRPPAKSATRAPTAGGAAR